MAPAEVVYLSGISLRVCQHLFHFCVAVVLGTSLYNFLSHPMSSDFIDTVGNVVS